MPPEFKDAYALRSIFTLFGARAEKYDTFLLCEGQLLMLPPASNLRHIKAMTHFMHFAVALNGDKAGQNLQGEDIARLVTAPDLAWVHMRADAKGTRDWIETNLSYLDRPAIDALLADETRPRVSQISKGVLIILRGVNHNEGADPEDMVSIRLWIDENRIISVARRGLTSVGEIRQRILDGSGPDTAGAFIYSLINQLNKGIETFRFKLDEATDILEQQVIEVPDQDQRRPIMERRLETIIFRRYITPQRDEVAHLFHTALDWLTPPDLRHLTESHNTLIRVVEDLDTIRERLQILKDELSSIMGDRLNKNMYILSVFTALFLPLGFLTGLFGVNLGGLPGLEYTDAFWIFSAILVLVVLLQVVLFRILRWF